ncbi:hypothetical protein WOC09_03205 [Vibrio parahaemolyticus]|nr:hypothetical protein [Vibrio parahaemolyticus]ELA9881428.1 hypothetical protein [Vibrio parahaemolyticus]ELB2963180.1 hypothetical protein [Vibrio parahaemolyticus]OOX29855.1 hypothetical protein BJL83_20165 [Vibrio parahaemolyticus]HCE1997889.1 hypothetical protein [Vibrio parahaemolyticus]
MLWPVVKPPQSSLYWLDEVHKNFYRLMFREEDIEDCFPAEFQTVLDGSAKTNEYFNSVYREYNQLSVEHKQSFRQIYDQQIGILPIYSDVQIALLKPNVKTPNTTEHKDLWNACKKLGGYLYSTTLGLRCFSNALDDKFDDVEFSDMHEHYQEFKRLNTPICSFCGLSPMTAEVVIEPEDGAELPEEKQRRASYDHYLPKAHYPFLAVDFNNLVPCCDTCNEDFKEEKDALSEEGDRTLSFIPYSQEHVRLQASYEKKRGGFYKMRVAILETGCALEEKGKTWDRIFGVLGRVNHLIDESFTEEWLAPLLADVERVDMAKRKLQREADRLELIKTTRKEVYYKSLSFSYLADSDDGVVEDLLLTIKDIYEPRRNAL